MSILGADDVPRSLFATIRAARLVLADASAAHAISMDDARALVAEGHAVMPIGAELEPPKLIVAVPADRVRTMAAPEPVRIRMGDGLLAFPCLMLLAFDTV